jgi:hypothetical protein
VRTRVADGEQGDVEEVVEEGEVKVETKPRILSSLVKVRKRKKSRSRRDNVDYVMYFVAMRLNPLRSDFYLML